MKHLLTIKLLQVQSGAFDIIVDATGSEVGINYNISFTEEENKPQNLKFTYDNVEYNSIEELENDLSGTIPVEEGDQTRILNIKWEWPYQTGENPEEIESNDLIDTQDAKNISNYTFDVIVTGNQIEPQA